MQNNFQMLNGNNMKNTIKPSQDKTVEKINNRSVAVQVLEDRGYRVGLANNFTYDFVVSIPSDGSGSNSPLYFTEVELIKFANTLLK